MLNRQSVLVVAPHPDDEAFGCGGTIRLLADSGVLVDVLFMTRGECGVDSRRPPSTAEKTELAKRRSAEAESSCALLGVRNVTFLAGRDGRLCEQPELAQDLQRTLRETPYDRVFCPWARDAHDDHKATFRWLRQALIALPERSIDVWLYEVWTPLPFTICVPIDSTIDAKLAAMRAHVSQLDTMNYLDGFLGLSAYRSLFCPGTRHAEAFLTGSRELIVNMGA